MRQQHAGLGQRRQHLGDVAQERVVRADDQHGPGGEQFAVRVEQVRRAVQRDGGLAGARAALHDEHAAQVGADHDVLLGLDGLDDVAHPAGAAGRDRGEQRRLAGEAVASGAARLAAGGVEVEHLVVEPDDGAPRVRMCRRRRTPSGAAAVAR